MDGAVIYRKEAEIGLLLLKNRPPNSGVTYSFCLKSCTGLGLSSGMRQQVYYLGSFTFVYFSVNTFVKIVDVDKYHKCLHFI